MNFRTWFNKNKLNSSDKMVEDLRVLADTSTFRYVSRAGFSSDDVVIRMIEDGWIFQNPNIPPEFTFNVVLEHFDNNPLLIGE
jgi:hypothetical protein